MTRHKTLSTYDALRCYFSPPVVFGKISEDVHIVSGLQESIGGADVVVLQDSSVIVQHGCVRPAEPTQLLTEK